jgi:ABC-type transporter Mla subunit MlaD
VQQDLRQTIASLHKTSDELAKFSSDDLPRLSHEASGVMTDAQGAILKTQGRVEELSKQLADDLAHTTALIDSVHSISDKIDKGQGTAGLLVNDPKLYQGLVDAERELNANLTVLQRLLEQSEQEGIPLKLK